MNRSSLCFVALALVTPLAACGYASDATFGDGTSGGASGLPGLPGFTDPKGGSSGGGSSGGGASSGTTPVDPTCHDSIQNGTEPDIDCGVACAKACAVGSGCAVPEDCTDHVCGAGHCQPATGTDLTQNGDETDIDCGGTTTGAARCDLGQKCLIAGDCASRGCKDSVCIEAPSCAVHFGGDTCGPDDDDASPNHESCCTSLPIQGYTDPNQPGKTVYLDKYEITAGRMRAFLTQMEADYGGQPNVQQWVNDYLVNAPAGTRWNSQWTEVLPSANLGSTLDYTVTDPSDPAHSLYPGNSQYVPNTQGSWSIVSGNYEIDTGVWYSLLNAHYFPEFQASGPPVEYAATHNFNCFNAETSYGYGTYWFPDDVFAQTGISGHKVNTQDVMDQKALNCTPNAVFAAFCMWDGGQLATTEAVDAVVNGAGGVIVPSGDCSNGIITISDATASGACANVYAYPPETLGNGYDESSRVAAPGRVPADVLTFGGQEWHDINGNLLENTMAADNAHFYYDSVNHKEGYGFSYGSYIHHVLQMTLPRGKEGGFGARCMRFK